MLTWADSPFSDRIGSTAFMDNSRYPRLPLWPPCGRGQASLEVGGWAGSGGTRLAVGHHRTRGRLTIAPSRETRRHKQGRGPAFCGVETAPGPSSPQPDHTLSSHQAALPLCRETTTTLDAQRLTLMVGRPQPPAGQRSRADGRTARPRLAVTIALTPRRAAPPECRRRVKLTPVRQASPAVRGSDFVRR